MAGVMVKRGSVSEFTVPPGAEEGPSPGVGGRQRGLGGPAGGGGYLDICTKNGRDDDPRMADLRQVGLPVLWLNIAHEIGFDAFMSIWSIFDRENIVADGRGREAVRLRVPQMRLYYRYQRNRYIQSLSATGMTSAQIRIIIRDEMGELLSKRHIERISAVTTENAL